MYIHTYTYRYLRYLRYNMLGIYIYNLINKCTTYILILIQKFTIRQRNNCYIGAVAAVAQPVAIAIYVYVPFHLKCFLVIVILILNIDNSNMQDWSSLFDLVNVKYPDEEGFTKERFTNISLTFYRDPSYSILHIGLPL